MTAICIGTMQVLANRWLALAVEEASAKLVACTSSDISSQSAEKSLKNTLHRLNQIRMVDDTLQSPRLITIGDQLIQLIKGKGHQFTLDEISQRNWSSARSIISQKLLEVPRGKVISYGGLAKQSRSSPRGVGIVMRSNPVPWAIPCHRVIHSDGKLGKLGGTVSGTKEKARILQAEGVPFNRDGTVKEQAIIS
ncbi:MAG: MGMT family protein [Candidatus Thorarchaeota archaeon]